MMILSLKTQLKLQKKWSHFLLFYYAAKSLFSGRFLSKHSHLAPAHTGASKWRVPANYFGVGVAPGPHPAYDEYICQALQDLGIKSVRIDISNEHKEAQMRLMDALNRAGIRLIVHFVQHPDDARNIARKGQLQRQWAEFIRYVLTAYQPFIDLVEIGSTVNRPRWSGYSLASFASAWRIAYPIVKEFGLTLAGPNITDFEPPYSELFLNQLKQMQMLPDVYSNNLFAERATEPERYDHKVMGHQLAGLLKFNLIKKAVTLKQYARQFDIQRMASLSSFWTLPRIQRYSIFSELKQADYLVRYLVLSIASGALEKAFWGPLICHREGLIDDAEEQYPQREKISYYEKVTGQLSKLSRRPSFYALRNVIAWLSDAEYLGQQSSLPGLQIHRFKKHQWVFDFTWCINGMGFSSHQVYDAEALQKASFFDMRGEALNQLPDFINEQPMILRWNDLQHVYRPIAPPSTLAVQICRYGYMDYFHLQDQSWQAVIAANLRSQAVQIFEFLRQQMQSQSSQHILRQGRNTVSQFSHPLNSHVQLVGKRPAKQHWHKRWLDKHKVNKSRAAWNASCQLMRRDIAVAQPVAFIEHLSDSGFANNLYICLAVPHQASVRELLASFNQGQAQFLGISKSRALQQLAQFIHKMHLRGVYYRDLSAGNILLDVQDDHLQMTLIDTNRARFYNHPVSMRQRISDLVRICNKMNQTDRAAFLNYYFAGAALKKPWLLLLPFWLYDSKVLLKRALGRKAWRKLWPSNRAK